MLSRIENTKRLDVTIMMRDMRLRGDMIAVFLLRYDPDVPSVRIRPIMSFIHSSAGGFFSFLFCRLLYCRCQVWIVECLFGSHLYGFSFFVFICFHSQRSDHPTCVVRRLQTPPSLQRHAPLDPTRGIGG